MASKATGSGSISTVFFSIALRSVSPIIIIIITIITTIIIIVIMILLLIIISRIHVNDHF